MRRRYTEAVACYDEVRAMAPENRPSLINKALALVLQGKLEAAEACYRDAQRAGPLPNNTLEPLLELRTAFAGLTESGLTVEADPLRPRRRRSSAKPAPQTSQPRGRSTGAADDGDRAGMLMAGASMADPVTSSENPPRCRATGPVVSTTPCSAARSRATWT